MSYIQSDFSEGINPYVYCNTPEAMNERNSQNASDMASKSKANYNNRNEVAFNGLNNLKGDTFKAGNTSFDDIATEFQEAISTVQTEADGRLADITAAWEAVQKAQEQDERAVREAQRAYDDEPIVKKRETYEWNDHGVKRESTRLVEDVEQTIKNREKAFNAKYNALKWKPNEGRPSYNYG